MLLGHLDGDRCRRRAVAAVGDGEGHRREAAGRHLGLVRRDVGGGRAGAEHEAAPRPSAVRRAVSRAVRGFTGSSGLVGLGSGVHGDGDLGGHLVEAVDAGDDLDRPVAGDGEVAAVDLEVAGAGDVRARARAGRSRPRAATGGREVVEGRRRTPARPRRRRRGGSRWGRPGWGRRRRSPSRRRAATVSEKIEPMPAAVRAGVTLTSTAVRATAAEQQAPLSIRTARRSRAPAFLGAEAMAGTSRKRFQRAEQGDERRRRATLASSSLP